METKYNMFVDEKYGVIQKIVPFIRYPGDDIYVCAAVGNLSLRLEKIGFGKSMKLAEDKAAEDYLAEYFKEELAIDMSKIAGDKIYACAFGDDRDYVIYQSKKRCVEMINNSNVNKSIYFSRETKDGENWVIGFKTVEVGQVKKFIVNASNTEERCRYELEEKYDTTQNIYHNLKKIVGIPLINCNEIMQEGFYCTKINFVSDVLEVIYDKKYYFCTTYLEDMGNE